MPEGLAPDIRPAVLSDAVLLAELGARTFSDTFSAANRPEDMATYLADSFSPEQQTAELDDPLSRFLIAEVQGVAVGYVMLHAGEPPEGISAVKPIEIVRFYVCREWHGRGVSKALMQECLNQTRDQYQTLWLGVWEHNTRARSFYRKWKFRDVGSHIFQLGADLQNDILMERRIQD